MLRTEVMAAQEQFAASRPSRRRRQHRAVLRPRAAAVGAVGDSSPEDDCAEDSGDPASCSWVDGVDAVMVVNMALRPSQRHLLWSRFAGDTRSRWTGRKSRGRRTRKAGSGSTNRPRDLGTCRGQRVPAHTRLESIRGGRDGHRGTGCVYKHTQRDPDELSLLSARGISKNFGAVCALKDIDLDVPPGQVTALAGDNGAGKSVLIKCFAGIHQPDEGQIYWEGQPVRIRHPADASALGIATVYQDLALCDNLDVVQNLFLGRELTHAGMLDEASMERATERTLRRLSVTTLTSLHRKVGSLSGGQRQAEAIAKALLWQAKLVILDEPTAALGVTQTRIVLGLVWRLAENGVAVRMISHNT